MGKRSKYISTSTDHINMFTSDWATCENINVDQHEWIIIWNFTDWTVLFFLMSSNNKKHLYNIVLFSVLRTVKSRFLFHRYVFYKLRSGRHWICIFSSLLLDPYTKLFFTTSIFIIRFIVVGQHFKVKQKVFIVSIMGLF